MFIVDTSDPSILTQTPDPAAPQGRGTKLEQSDRQHPSWDQVDYSNQRLHAVDFLADILTYDRRLQVRKHALGIQHRKSRVARSPLLLVRPFVSEWLRR